MGFVIEEITRNCSCYKNRCRILHFLGVGYVDSNIAAAWTPAEWCFEVKGAPPQTFQTFYSLVLSLPLLWSFSCFLLLHNICRSIQAPFALKVSPEAMSKPPTTSHFTVPLPFFCFLLLSSLSLKSLASDRWTLFMSGCSSNLVVIRAKRE